MDELTHCSQKSLPSLPLMVHRKAVFPNRLKSSLTAKKIMRGVQEFSISCIDPVSITKNPFWHHSHIYNGRPQTLRPLGQCSLDPHRLPTPSRVRRLLTLGKDHLWATTLYAPRLSVCSWCSCVELLSPLPKQTE